jgi:hypothetical protein
MLDSSVGRLELDQRDMRSMNLRGSTLTRRGTKRSILSCQGYGCVEHCPIDKVGRLEMGMIIKNDEGCVCIIRAASPSNPPNPSTSQPVSEPFVFCFHLLQDRTKASGTATSIILIRVCHEATNETLKEKRTKLSQKYNPALYACLLCLNQKRPHKKNHSTSINNFSRGCPIEA